jgi:hypothetical protein
MVCTDIFTNETGRSLKINSPLKSVNACVSRPSICTTAPGIGSLLTSSTTDPERIA